ncbi:hypothetical protein ZWY2020_058135 [Hordeum vulgare]|nr:hypothetical protein ZWY2020_058135 [Hordeum vulgare]
MATPPMNRGIGLAQASSITEIKLARTWLNGSLGYELSNLFSLKTLDLSNNHIQGLIPYQLPQNLTYLNLATNIFCGNLPYSISNMPSILYPSPKPMKFEV